MINRTLNRSKTIIITASIIVIIYNHFFFDVAPNSTTTISCLNDLQKEVLKWLFELNKLLLTLSTALFGFIGILLFKQERTQQIIAKIKTNIVLVVCFTALSIDFGFILMEKITEQLANDMFSPFETMIRYPQMMQFIMFLFALIFSGKIFMNFLNDKK